MSVVVPSYRATATLDRCVESLLAQEVEAVYEVIVVSSADEEHELPPVHPDPRLRVISHVPRLSAAAARNQGASMARGRFLAFADADVVAAPDWLARLLAASRGTHCVAGAVLNGTPASAVGTAEYLVEFLDLHPRRPPASARHGATCNLLVPRAVWDRHGPFPEDMEGGEDTLLTAAAEREGAFAFAPDAAVTHHNRTRLGTVLSHQVAFGRFSARLARRTAVKGRVLLIASPLAPVAGLARVASVYARVARWDAKLLPRALRIAPVVSLLLGAWATGLAAEGFRLDADAVRARCARRGRNPVSR